MIACLLGVLLGAGGADASPKARVLTLFAKADWYQQASEPEQVYEGKVELIPTNGQIGKPSRFNTYRLTWNDSVGEARSLELHVPGKAQFLAGYLNQRVRITGKAVDVKGDERFYHELWPARLEVPDPNAKETATGILARCGWQPVARRREASVHVITDGTELARQRGYFGNRVEEKATEDLARELGVAKIDWKKQMVVCVSDGLHINGEQVHISRVELQNRVLIVAYQLKVPAEPVEGLAYPAETVLVERFDGQVQVRREVVPPR
jgi:hypothetical protein